MFNKLISVFIPVELYSLNSYLENSFIVFGYQNYFDYSIEVILEKPEIKQPNVLSKILIIVAIIFFMFLVYYNFDFLSLCILTQLTS